MREDNFIKKALKISASVGCGFEGDSEDAKSILSFITDLESHIAELEADKERTEAMATAFQERNAELELRLDVYHGNMYDVVVAENATLRERIAELENELSNKEIEYTDLWDDALALQALVESLAERKAMITRLIELGQDMRFRLVTYDDIDPAVMKWADFLFQLRNK